MQICERILASTMAVLDSDVHTGGGTDVTEALQAVLDQGKDGKGVYLVMDGAALVRGLRVYSNTTIQCLSKDCGFYQKAGSDRAILTNAHWNRTGITDRNIVLMGGTYNQNCLNQSHDMAGEDLWYAVGAVFEGGPHGVHGLEFYGVEDLTVRDVVIEDFRTYAFAMGSFSRVTIENCWLSLPNRMQAQNQDGFHFWGPGKYLTMRDIGGRVGDDFMNIGPDECDLVSDITDVLIDGVMLDEADQGIRLLSRCRGRLDRITIRNVIGTYRSFGFYVLPFFTEEHAGNFGEILFENIDLKAMQPNYDYRTPVLFSVGGNMECLMLKNIRCHDPYDNRTLLEFGISTYATTPENIDTYFFPGDGRPVMGNILVDGLTITGESARADGANYIQVYDRIKNLVVKNVTELRSEDKTIGGSLLAIHGAAKVDRLVLSDVLTDGFAQLVDGAQRVGACLQTNVVQLP